MITNKNIDSGKEFDWGKTSSDYAKYRDIYPKEFYQKIIDMGLCVKGQKVLDIATGTGVLPRNLYKYGANFVGSDISENQILEARRMSLESNMDINYIVSSAENLDFSDNYFDVVTACQCFFYFDNSIVMPKIANILKPNGRFAILYMGWLSEESKIARESEKLVLSYNPLWSGTGGTRQKIEVPNEAYNVFNVEDSFIFDLNIPFTRESWNGRIKACRGIGASLNDEEIQNFEVEHKALLNQIAPQQFHILHYVAMLVLRVKK